MASIFRLPSNNWRALIRRKGVTRSATFRTKAQAERFARAIEDGIDAGSATGVLAVPRTITLGKTITAFLEDVKVGRTATASLKATATVIGNVPLSDLNSMHMQKFVSKRRADKVSGATLAGDLSHLSAVLRWARHSRNLDVNDRLAREARSSLTALRITTRSRERTRLPTDDEIEQLVAYLDARPHQSIPAGQIVRFAAVSALRLGEICAVKIEDIDRTGRTVIVRARKHPTDKDRNDQVVPLVGAAFDIAMAAAGKRKSGRLFPVDARSVSAAFTRAVTALDIPDLHFHDLRHRAVTDLFRKGLSIQLVALVSGHADWKHLRRYTQLTAADVHSALANIALSESRRL